MFLFEEYYKRVGIEFNPIKYCDSFVFLKDNKILQIKKQNKDYGPNNFKVSIISKENSADIEVEWDEYENYINKNYAHKKNAIYDELDIFIFAWEFFLVKYNYSFFIFDFNILYNTIDHNLEKHFRKKEIIGFIENYLYYEKNLYEHWLEMNNNLNCYSYWLAKIINE